ncbi:hypothetical protein ACTSKR_03875 [Chitinibacteraceae bacterium HSL-7]
MMFAGLLMPLAAWALLALDLPLWWLAPVIALVTAAQWRKSSTKLLLAAALVCALVALVQGNSWPVKLYPVLVNAGALTLFAASLTQRQSLIEKLARLREPDLPAYAVRYTRRVTQVWCLFFIANGTIAAWTTTQSDAVWTTYNGLIAYLAMGAMFIGEYLIRQRVRARHG